VQIQLDLALSVAKDLERSDLNEDAFDIGTDGNTYALSDGASESYDSKSWARLLVEKFTEDSAFNNEWVVSVQKKYESNVDFQSLSWSKQLAFERGSFATLLGLNHSENFVKIFSIGDSLAVHIRNDFYLDSYPFHDAEQFDSRPELLSTLAHLNTFTDDSQFINEEHSIQWQLEKGDLIYMLTDAVGQWFLREIESEKSSIKVLSEVTNEDDFLSLITTLRSERRVKLDDSTMLRFIVKVDEIENGLSND
jgi:hypothetical protein